MTSQTTGDLAAIVAHNVRSARSDAGLTQRGLAERVDTDAALVSKWERAIHRPSDDTLAAIAHHTGKVLTWFYVDRRAASGAWVGDDALPDGHHGLPAVA